MMGERIDEVRDGHTVVYQIREKSDTESSYDDSSEETSTGGALSAGWKLARLKEGKEVKTLLGLYWWLKSDVDGPKFVK